MTEIDLTPITRLEYDIDAILNDHAVAEPITRIELILADIVAGNTTTVVPVTRIETYLAIISGADYSVPEPVTRIETFLAIIAGGDYEAPEPATRLEGLLAEWVEKGSGIWKTVSGTLIHITDALASPVQALSVAIEPQQSGSGDPSPTNVRPITGWTGCNIRHTGKNLFDKTNISENNRYIKSDGSLVSNSSWVVSSYIHVKAGETYTLSNYQNSNTSAPGVRYYGNDGGIVGFSYGSTRTKTFTVPNGASTMRISVMASLIDSCQLELGSTATTHEDYQGTTYPISWQTEAGTVYGGTLTVNEDGSCDVVADRAIVTMDGVTSGATKFYAKAGATNCHQYYARFTYGKKYSSDRIVRGNVCTHALDLPVEAGESLNVTVPDGKAYFIYWYSSSSTYHGQPRLAFPLTSDIDTLTKANQFLADQYANGTPVQYTFLMTEPVTYHLESIAQITTLAGENNIWADVNGTITLTYKSNGMDSDKADTGKADFMKLLS